MRILDRRGHIFGTMTPLKGLTWVYDEIYLNAHSSKEVWYEFMEWADNPYLSAEEIAEISASLSADMLESRRYGKFTGNTGLVYGEFGELNVIEPRELPAEWQDTLSIDPGLNNPLSCHWYCQDYDGNVYVVAEYYEANRNVDYHAQRIKEICRKLNWKRNRDGSINALCDSAANQRTLASEKSVAELFCEQGIAVNTKVNKSVYFGINKVKALIKPLVGLPKLYVFSNCVNMIREFKSYFWGNDDNPVKRDDHAMDELRYYVCAMQKKMRAEEKSRVARDKERLYRRLRRGRV